MFGFFRRRRGRRATLATLRDALRSTDTGALLTPSRVLRRVVKEDAGVSSLALHVPHADSYALSRDRFLEIIDRCDLGTAPETLPEQLVLLVEPHPRELDQRGLPELLHVAWRRLFHGRIDGALRDALSGPDWGEDALNAVIDRLGPSAFEEIRAVLHHEERLIQPENDREVVAEFLALYAELNHFQPWLVARYFPALRERERVDALIGSLMDVPAILAATRPLGAEDLDVAPAFARDPDEPPPSVPNGARSAKLARLGERFHGAGNNARAAILLAAAARISDGENRARWQSSREALFRLCERLTQTLATQQTDPEVWQHALWPLVASSGSAAFNPESRLLYDLQKACRAQGEAIFHIGPVTWLLSFFRRPFLRRLSLGRPVRVLKHLRSARRRLGRLSVTRSDRDRLRPLLDGVLRDVEEPMREAFRPIVKVALQEEGFDPANRVEEVAAAKLVEELLDTVVRRGFITLGNLRDAVARNDLKLPNLSWSDLIRGDALLRADARLARDLDGVYRRGEVYLRFLQRLSALGFGTWLGRQLTRFGILTFGGAFVILEGLQHTLVPLVKALGGPSLALVNSASVVITGLALMGLIHSAKIRRGVVVALGHAGRALHTLTLGAFTRLLAVEWVRDLMASRPFTLTLKYLIKPLVLGAGLWFLVPVFGGSLEASAISAAALFFLMNGLLNSRVGRRVEEAILDRLAGGWRTLRYHVVPGLLEVIIETFKRVMDGLERLLYKVDEWLRLRGGDGKVTLVIKLGLGLVWSVVNYIIRIYITLLVEPQVNPIKHFPVVTVSHKIILPFTIQLTEMMSAPLVPVFGNVVGKSIAGGTVFLLPGVFGFLVWELKSNWRVFGQNRSPQLQAAIIGHHSETMLRFMRPGFHSGTLPKLYRRLRDAESRRHTRRAAKARAGLLEVGHDVENYLTRGLLAYLARDDHWRGHPVRCGPIQLASNRISVTLECPSLKADHAAVLAFDEKAGRLRAGFVVPGWIDRLDLAQRVALRRAVIGAYKVAGVDFVREELSRRLGPHELRHGRLIVTDMEGARHELALNGAVAKSGSPLPWTLDELSLKSHPVSTSEWVGAWRSDAPKDGVSLAKGVRILPLAS